jgi:hypothetical protein
MANHWDQAGWYMGDGIPTGGEESEPTDSLEVFSSRAAAPSVGNVLSPPPPLSAPLSPESQIKMSRSIMDIFEPEESTNDDTEMLDDDEEELAVDLEDQRRRTDRLGGVLPALAQLWWSDSDQITLVAEKLGDGSRDRELLSLLNTDHHFSAHTEFHPLSQVQTE